MRLIQEIRTLREAALTTLRVELVMEVEPDMITIFFSVTVKRECQSEFEILAREMTASTRSQDEGCIAYAFYRRGDQPRDFVLYEQWKDAAALASHLQRLSQVLGPPDDQEPYPETHHRRRLPKALLALLETSDAVRYEALE